MCKNSDFVFYFTLELSWMWWCFWIIIWKFFQKQLVVTTYGLDNCLMAHRGTYCLPHPDCRTCSSHPNCQRPSQGIWHGVWWHLALSTHCCCAQGFHVHTDSLAPLMAAAHLRCHCVQWKPNWNNHKLWPWTCWQSLAFGIRGTVLWKQTPQEKWQPGDSVLTTTSHDLLQLNFTPSYLLWLFCLHQ